MIARAIPPMILPRSRALTDVLTDPGGTPVRRSDLAAIRRNLEVCLRASAAAFELGHRVCIDAYWLRSAGGPVQQGGTFEWSPATARRPIALDAVRRWLASRETTPARAVASTVQRLVTTANDPAAGRRTLGSWLAGLGLGARSLVEAEAVTLATQLATALDWERLTRPVVGDDRTVSFATSPLAFLRGRVEVRCSVEPGPLEPGAPRSSALLVLMGGRPLPTSPSEMGLVALTVALSSRSEVPIRVVGWWPHCGRALALPVDTELLEETVGAIGARLRSAGRDHPIRPQPDGHGAHGTAQAPGQVRLAS